MKTLRPLRLKTTTIKIKHLTYQQIDFKKYNDCIEKSYNKRIYALSWYLDIVTKHNWEVLILDDYKAVMPLPFSRIKRKFLKRLIAQPLFCQQLGIFSKSKLNQTNFNNITQHFFKLNPFSYHFNGFQTNELSEYQHLQKRVNYQLSLDEKHNEISTKYSKNLKRNIKKGKKTGIQITNQVSVDNFILMKKNNSIHKIKKTHYKVMQQLITEIIAKQSGKFYGVQLEKKLIAIAFFTNYNNRLTHLFSVSTTQGKSIAAIPFLFDTIIKANSNKNVTFDFEGSMIPGVAKFFKSFGAVDVPYIVSL